MFSILAAAVPPTPTALPQQLPPYSIEFGPAAAEVVMPALLLVIATGLLHRRIVARLVHDKALAATIHSADAILAAISAAVVAIWRIWDLDSWSGQAARPPVHALAVVVTLVFAVLCTKWLVHRAAAAEREQIKKLRLDADLLEEHRNWLLSTIDTVDQILGEKFDRTKKLLKGERVTREDLSGAAPIEQQMHVIVKSIHSFFQKQLHYGETLRLGIYILSDEDRNSLVRAYAVDGKNSENSFHEESATFLKLLRPEGAVSFIVQCYLGVETIRIIGDTWGKDAGFEFFREDQRNRIRSVLGYRFIVPTEGEDSVWVIYMDASRSQFFDPAKKASYMTFLQQASKRIAFEAAARQLLDRVRD